MSDLHELDYRKCREMLGANVVGRVAVCLPEGPQIIPVNYAVSEESIVFRTAPYTVLGQHAWKSRLAFEIDHLDYERQVGWSVVATGRGEMVDDEHELQGIRAFWDPRPWAGGVRLLYVRLRWERLTGRRLGSGWTAPNETPVRRTL
jgi:hypothetical protein